MTDLNMAAAGRRQTFFKDEGVDQLVSIMLELAAELWSVRQRLFIVERVTEGQSRPLNELVEAYKPTEAEQAELEAMRGRMVREMFRVLEQPKGTEAVA